MKKKLLLFLVATLAFLTFGLVKAYASDVTINALNIKPVVGGTPQSITLSQIEETTYPGDYSIKSQEWLDVTGGNVAVTTFEAGKTYSYTLTLKGENGNVVDGDQLFEIRMGDEWIDENVSYNIAANEMTFTGKYTLPGGIAPEPTEPVHIGNVIIDGSLIMPNVPGAPVAVADTEKYTVERDYWMDFDTSAKATSFEDGKKYNYSLGLKAKEGYYFDETDKIIFDGLTFYNFDTSYDGTYLTFNGYTWAYANKYEFIEGKNAVFNDLNNLIFKVDAPISKFKEVYIDNVLVLSTLYTVTEGSTIITITPERAAEIIRDDDRLIKIVFEDGVAMTNFRIEIDNNDSGEDEGTTPVPGGIDETEGTEINEDLERDDVLEELEREDVPKELEKTDEVKTPEAKTLNNPKTRDNVITYIILGLLSLTGITSIAFYTKKRKLML